MQSDSYKVSVKHFFIYTAISYAVLFIVCFSIFVMVQWRVREAKIQEIEAREASIVLLSETFVGNEFISVIADLNYLVKIYKDKLNTERLKNGLEANWMEFVRQNMMYDQLRYIDPMGKEVIRINYKNGSSNLVPEEELQDKSDRYYFTESLKLSEGQIYVSPIDLNIEGGEIEIPYKSVMRFCAPVCVDGDFCGVIVLNYIADRMLYSFSKIAGHSAGTIVLLNSDGYWISHSDSSKEWAFMFEGRENETFKIQSPNAWEALISGEQSLLDKEAYYTFSRVDLKKKMEENVDMTGDKIVMGGGDWYIVSTVMYGDYPDLHIRDTPVQFAFEVIFENYFMIIVLFLIAAAFGFLLYLYMGAYRKTQYYSKYDKLTGVYNRRTATNKLDAMLETKERKNYCLSICFVDVNGLKQVNDMLGHKYGDELITTVARVMGNNVREGDFVARMGGDEFLIVLSRADAAASEAVWKRITNALEEINITQDRPYTISVSHGIVTCGEEHTCATTDLLISSADEKMYEEKRIIKRNLDVIRHVEV